MTYRRCKHRCKCLQIQGHKATIRCSQTSDLVGIDKGMGTAQFLGPFYYVFCRAFAPCVHMSRGKLLAVANCSRRIQDIYYIITGCKQLRAVRRRYTVLRRHRAAIIIHYERILLRRVKFRRIAYVSVYRCSVRSCKRPLFILACLYLGQSLRQGIIQQFVSAFAYVEKTCRTCMRAVLSPIRQRWTMAAH